MNYGWLILVAVSVSFLLTAALRKYAIARSLMDIPNARSSHVVATPRGGGVAIVVAFVLSLVFLYACGLMSGAVFIAFTGAGAAIALIGFMDDHGHIAARWRLLGHFAAAVWLLVWIGGLPAIVVFGVSVEFGWVGHVLAAFIWSGCSISTISWTASMASPVLKLSPPVLARACCMVCRARTR
jgi:Fuc2NAc and GlcNAc transferase